MLNLIEKLKSIEFPRQEDLEWSGWPSLPANICIPDDVEFWYAGDMLQLGAIVKDDNINYLVCNKENRIGLLKSVLELIIPGKFTWYDLRRNFGIHDYFWFGYSVECGITDIEDMPSWCLDVWDLFIQERLVTVLKDEDIEIYYLKKYNSIPFNLVKQVHCKLLPLLLDEIIKYQSERINNGDITNDEYLEIIEDSKSIISELYGLVEDDFRRRSAESLCYWRRSHEKVTSSVDIKNALGEDLTN